MMSKAGIYDIIGDIHGHSRSLTALLKKLDYNCTDGVYGHPARKVIFLGDFIDRGPCQREVIDLVRPMVESGTALAIMGNHEFNAIAYATPGTEPGSFLRPHSEKNRKQHAAFLATYGETPADYADVINWFRTLPLWLDLGDLKLIHACWDRQWVARLGESQAGSPYLDEALLYQAARKGTWQYEAIETLLKGKEIPLKLGASFRDKDDNVRHNIRVRWWDRSAVTYRDAFMGPESARTHIPDEEVRGDHLVEYAHDEAPVFLGHYWLEGVPAPLAANIACLDYSVAKPGGKLVAYRWDGERRLRDDRFVWVERVETGA